MPIRETCTAYDEGEYEIVNRYVMIMIADYKQDLQFIRSKLYEGGVSVEYEFSYVTEDEKNLILQLLDKDKERHIINNADKDILVSMGNVKL